jgi:hypothetical protein
MKLSFSGKCSDMCSYLITDDNGEKLVYKQGEIPSSFGIGGGDYVEFEIDLETGQILNWKKPTDEAIKIAIHGEDYEE